MADAVLRLASETAASRGVVGSSSGGRGRVKLPPLFSPPIRRGTVATTNGRKCLVAFLAALADYEEGDIYNGSYPTLSELPSLWMQYAAKIGANALDSEPPLRRAHNWVHQVGFAVRAAVLDAEITSGDRIAAVSSVTATKEIRKARETLAVNRTLLRLYANPRRAFVAHAPDNRNEYKPLRAVPADTLRKWVSEEAVQRRKAIADSYGATPSPEDWSLYGKGSARTVCAALLAHVRRMKMEARRADAEGRSADASAVDERLAHFERNFTFLHRVAPDDQTDVQSTNEH